STVLPRDALPQHLLDLAVHATAALGLPFGGVDLVPEHGGKVFEVNVHPVLDVPQGFRTVTLPYVQAHLSHPDTRNSLKPTSSSTHRTRSADITPAAMPHITAPGWVSDPTRRR
ncbi:hypothetical protein ACW9HQ_44365, partial [Nocardia gipuzkoensis]